MKDNLGLKPADFDHGAIAKKLLDGHELLKERIVTKAKVATGKESRALAEVIRFLNLIAYYDETLTPSKRVDDVWHEFILFTKIYFDFCQHHFGRIIHHHPGGTKEKNKSQFSNTLARYEKHFGIPDPYFWGRSKPKEATKCGTCESF